VVELNRDYPSSNIVLAGDFNLLPESVVVERTGFDQLVQQPTRGANTLDLVFVSMSMYDVTRVVDSVVKSDHKAVIVCNDQRVATCNKRIEIKTYRKKSPNQHASFLEHIATIEFYLPHTDIQAAFVSSIPLLYSSIITFILNDHLLFLPVIQTTLPLILKPHSVAKIN